MKRIFLFAAFLLPLLWTACSDTPADEVKEDVVPKGMSALDLTTLGFPVKINVPDSNFFPTLDTAETPTGIRIHLGQHYDLLVNTATAEEGDLQKIKPVLQAADELDETFIVNDSNLLVWETKIGDMPLAQHFYYVVKIDGNTFVVRDNYTNTENAFKKEDIDRMVESAKSLRAKPAAAKPEA